MPDVYSGTGQLRVRDPRGALQHRPALIITRLTTLDVPVQGTQNDTSPLEADTPIDYSTLVHHRTEFTCTKLVLHREAFQLLPVRKDLD